jgi:hypothetical protein
MTPTRAFEDRIFPEVKRRLERAVRVRQTVYLWGSAGITANVNFATPRVLHVLNDKHGEVVTLATATTAGQTALGTLRPGECFSIQIQAMTGVVATCASETTVFCLISDR